MHSLHNIITDEREEGRCGRRGGLGGEGGGGWLRGGPELWQGRCTKPTGWCDQSP